MKKITVNEIILAATIFILAFLFIKEAIEIKNATSLFEISPSLAMLFLGIVIIFIMPLLTGFVLAVPFVLFTKKEKFKKTLRYISYFALSFLLLLFIYYLLERYTDIFKNFYGFTDFAEFMYYFKYDKGPLLWIAIVQFCIDTVTFFLFAAKSWISFMAGFIFHVCLETRKLENKKRGS